jgi:hypothetical protein
MLTFLALFLAVATRGTSSIETTIYGTNIPLDVSLFRREGEHEWRMVATGHIPIAQRRIRFDSLDAGVYQVRMRGAANGEIAATNVILGVGEMRRADINIKSITVTGRVTIGDIPLVNAVVILKNREFQWEATLTANANGVLNDRLWQPGSFDVTVRSLALATPFIGRAEVRQDTLQLDFSLPNRRLVGNVRERASGTPVAGAALEIEMEVGDSKRHFHTQADANGHFELAGMVPSTVTITASREAYLNGKSARVILTESDRVREITIAIERGIVISMAVSDSAGCPLSGATLLTVADQSIRAGTITDRNGIAPVTLPHGFPATVYVIPQDGSFAVVHVVNAENTPHDIVVPRASSTLRIITRTVEGKPLSGIAFLMRANGELIPPSIAAELLNLQGLSLRTDGRGEMLLRNLPTGSYEFWPYSTPVEAEALAETVASLRPPIMADVKSGENTIVVNFRAR